MRTIHVLWGLFALLPPQDGATTLRVVSDFPGGSAQVDGIDQEQRVVKIQPAERTGHGWRCWWYFRLDGIRPGETVTVEVEGDPFTLPDRAHFSPDGKTWCHTEAGARADKRVTYRQAVEGSSAWFAWGPPYLLADAEAAVRNAAAVCRESAAFTLCTSRDGHAVPAIRFGPEKIDSSRFGLWIQARQHAWESGGSWVAQGFLEWLASDAAEAKTLRERSSITIVPIMDIDNVQRGAGGKDQIPQDHNRDWSARPQHPEVRAAMERILEMDRAGAVLLPSCRRDPVRQRTAQRGAADRGRPGARRRAAGVRGEDEDLGAELRQELEADQQLLDRLEPEGARHRGDARDAVEHAGEHDRGLQGRRPRAGRGAGALPARVAEEVGRPYLVLGNSKASSGISPFSSHSWNVSMTVDLPTST